MYPSTEMLISVQKYKLHHRKISPILGTQITASVQKKNINLLAQKHKLQNKHVHCSVRHGKTKLFRYRKCQLIQI